jgi:hypothetical protein
VVVEVVCGSSWSWTHMVWKMEEEVAVVDTSSIHMESKMVAGAGVVGECSK